MKTERYVCCDNSGRLASGNSYGSEKEAMEKSNEYFGDGETRYVCKLVPVKKIFKNKSGEDVVIF